MSALSESLVAAQRQAIAALEKAYISGRADADILRAALNSFGSTDVVEQDQLLYALDALKAFGAAAPETAKPDTSHEPATDRQLKFARDLADERGMVLPDYSLTKASASKLIEQLQAGTYNPDEWTVPF